MASKLAPNEAREQPYCKVLILGAGVSGIVAGKTLLDNGVDDFIILEGQNYIGGRVKQHSFAGFKIEEGANWIQFGDDEETQPIWIVKEKKQLTGVWTDYFDLVVRNELGEDVTNPDDLQKWHQLRETTDSLERPTLSDNVSIREGLNTLGWTPNTPAQWAIDYLFNDFELGCTADKMTFNDHFFVPKKEFFLTDSRGMISLYESIISKVQSRVKLNTKVEKIIYSDSVVKVTTSSGEVYTSDYCLCTFSTGVLASDMVKFVPPLPQWKHDAILKLPMTVYTKIFLKFDKKFWDDKEYVLFASERRGFYPVFQNLESPGKFPSGSGLLLVTVTGDEGRRIEQQSFEKTKEEIMDVMRGVYGANIPEPTDIFYPRWSTNPFIRGAFSGHVIETTSEHIEQIGQNIHNLYFAGEATSEWHGYMQGAYLSGQEKGKILAELLINNKLEKG